MRTADGVLAEIGRLHARGVNITTAAHRLGFCTPSNMRRWLASRGLGCPWPMGHQPSNTIAHQYFQDTGETVGQAVERMYGAGYSIAHASAEIGYSTSAELRQVLQRRGLDCPWPPGRPAYYRHRDAIRPTMVDQYIALRRRGYTCADAAQRVGRSEGGLREAVRRMRPEVYAELSEWKPLRERAHDLLPLLRGEATVGDIALMVDRSTEQVGKYLRLLHRGGRVERIVISKRKIRWRAKPDHQSGRRCGEGRVNQGVQRGAENLGRS